MRLADHRKYIISSELYLSVIAVVISIPSATTVTRLDTLPVTVDPVAALALDLVNATEEAETRAHPTHHATATATIVDVHRLVEEVLAVTAMIAAMTVIAIDAVVAETAAMTGVIAMIVAKIDVSMREGISIVMDADTPEAAIERTLRICTVAELPLIRVEGAQDHLAQALERASALPVMIRQIVKTRVLMITVIDLLVKIVKLITSVPVVKTTPSAKIVHLPVVLTLELLLAAQLPVKPTTPRMEKTKIEKTLAHAVRVVTAITDQKLSCLRNKAVINCNKKKTKKMIRKLDASGA